MWARSFRDTWSPSRGRATMSNTRAKTHNKKKNTSAGRIAESGSECNRQRKKKKKKKTKPHSWKRHDRLRTGNHQPGRLGLGRRPCLRNRVSRKWRRRRPGCTCTPQRWRSNPRCFVCVPQGRIPKRGSKRKEHESRARALTFTARISSHARPTHKLSDHVRRGLEVVEGVGVGSKRPAAATVRN